MIARRRRRSSLAGCLAVPGTRDRPRRGPASSPSPGSGASPSTRDDEGLPPGWYGRTFPDTVTLPGRDGGPGVRRRRDRRDRVDRAASWTAPGSRRPRYAPYREPGNVKVPFWLQPEKHYLGAAWYQRDVDGPGGVEGPAAGPAASSGRTGRPWCGSTSRRSARTTASRRPTSTTSGTGSRPGAHRLTDPRRQPHGRRRRPRLPQRQRPHPGQLERHRRPDRAAGRGAGLDRRPAGVSAGGLPVGRGEGADRQRHRRSRDEARCGWPWSRGRARPEPP